MHRASAFALFLAFAGVVAADSPRILRETRDDRHVAVIGDGFLRAEDADETVYLLRSCTLAENSDGELCASVDGKLLKLDPPIVVPNDSTRILIDPCGYVSVLQRGQGDRIQIGMIEVSFVRHRVGMREVAPGVLVCGEHFVPVTDAFGEQTGTFLMQGWIDQAPSEEAK
jgi:flagellar basal-body rod protein FlgG